MCSLNGFPVFVQRRVIWQIGANPDSGLIAEASHHLSRAAEAQRQAGSDENLARKMEEAEARIAEVTDWARVCEECEDTVRRGKEALAAGNRDEAAGHCRAARGLLDRGSKSEVLHGAVKELEREINTGKICLISCVF